MVSQKAVSVLILLVVVLLAGTSYGRTWSVERDGSGDFTVIQDAVNAASSGDEIRIGPGRYTEYMQLSGGRRFYVYNDGSKDLTFIGSGADQTIIGPIAYTENYTEWGIGCIAGNVTIVAEDLCFKNINYGGVGSMVNEFIIRRCLFDHCYTGAFFSDGANTAIIEDSRFINGAGIFSTGVIAMVPHVHVTRCFFSSYAGGVDVQYGGATDVFIRDCTFEGGEFGHIGVTVNTGSDGTIENCHFSGLDYWGFAYHNGGTIVFRDNVIDATGGFGCIKIGDAAHVTIEGNILVGGQRCFFLLGATGGQYEIYGNHIFRDESIGGYFVEAASDWDFDELHYDFSENYWGTTDTDYIAEWILDGYDLEGVTLYADFLPIADGPVPTESTTWGAVKTLFR